MLEQNTEVNLKETSRALCLRPSEKWTASVPIDASRPTGPNAAIPIGAPHENF